MSCTPKGREIGGRPPPIPGQVWEKSAQLPDPFHIAAYPVSCHRPIPTKQNSGVCSA